MILRSPIKTTLQEEDDGGGADEDVIYLHVMPQVAEQRHTRELLFLQKVQKPEEDQSARRLHQVHRISVPPLGMHVWVRARERFAWLKCSTVVSSPKCYYLSVCVCAVSSGSRALFLGVLSLCEVRLRCISYSAIYSTGESHPRGGELKDFSNSRPLFSFCHVPVVKHHLHHQLRRIRRTCNVHVYM